MSSEQPPKQRRLLRLFDDNYLQPAVPFFRRVPHPRLLVFKSPQSFLTAFSSTLSKLTSECESGPRIGCSLSASQNCSPPWYKQFFLFGISCTSCKDFKEREECEVREMKASSPLLRRSVSVRGNSS